MKIAIIIAGVAMTAFFWTDIREATASSFMSKSANEKTAITDTEHVLPPSAGITVVKKWDLPKELAEVSGLAYIDNDRFACVQDELGTVFILIPVHLLSKKKFPLPVQAITKDLRLQVMLFG